MGEKRKHKHIGGRVGRKEATRKINTYVDEYLREIGWGWYEKD
jgi:hypothetical protein